MTFSTCDVQHVRFDRGDVWQVRFNRGEVQQIYDYTEKMFTGVRLTYITYFEITQTDNCTMKCTSRHGITAKPRKDLVFLMD